MPTPRSQFRLPRARHASPWRSRAIVLVSIVALVLLVPLWLDPVTFNELRNVTPEPRTSPSTQAVVPIPAQSGLSGPTSTLARDSFERSVTIGLGAADTGGQYTITGRAEGLAVVDGVATVQLVSGESGSAVLPAARARDVDVTLLLDAANRPTGGELQVAVVLRQLDDGSEYRVTVHLPASGPAALSVEVFSAGVTSTVAGPIAVVDAGPGPIKIRATVEGSDPATISARAWTATSPEPAYWHASIVDWTGSLQAEGSVGLAWALPGAAVNGSVTLRVDDLLAASADGGE